MCKHAKLKSLVTSIALQLIDGTDMAFDQDQFCDIYWSYKIQWYMIAILLLILLGIIFIITTKVRKLRLFSGHLFSNVVKVMFFFVLDVQTYVPVKLCKVAVSIHLFKLVGKLMPECVTLNRNWIWDILKLDWKEVRVTLNRNKINFPSNNFRIRWLVSRAPAPAYNAEAWYDLVCFRT